MTYLFIGITHLLIILDPSPKEFICKYTNTTIIIDSDLKEWGNATEIIIRDTSAGGDNQMNVKTLWDEHNLYLAYRVKDNDLISMQTELDHHQLYLDDMIEFLFDAQNEKDSCWDTNDIIYHINLLGQKKDDRGSADCNSNPNWNGDARYTIQLSGTLNNSTDSDTGYIIEISIPWDEIGIEPLSGLKIGVNFANGDKDGNHNSFFDWVGANPFRSPYAFGNLILKK